MHNNTDFGMFIHSGRPPAAQGNRAQGTGNRNGRCRIFPLPPLSRGGAERSEAEGLSQGDPGTRFFWRPAQKPGNFTPAHAARGLFVSMVFGCRPPFPMGISDKGRNNTGIFLQGRRTTQALPSPMGKVAAPQALTDEVWSGIINVQSRNSPRSDRIRITGR